MFIFILSYNYVSCKLQRDTDLYTYEMCMDLNLRARNCHAVFFFNDNPYMYLYTRLLMSTLASSINKNINETTSSLTKKQQVSQPQQLLFRQVSATTAARLNNIIKC